MIFNIFNINFISYDFPKKLFLSFDSRDFCLKMSDPVTKFLESNGILNRNDPVGAPSAHLNHQDDDQNNQSEYSSPTQGQNNKFLMVGLICVFLVFFGQFTQGTIVFLLEHLILKVVLICLFGYMYGLDNGVQKLDQYHTQFNCFLKEKCRSAFQYLDATWKDKMH